MGGANPCNPCKVSCNPVRFFDGQLRLEVTDVATGGFGLGWAHRRTFANQTVESFDRGNGWNWSLENWPVLIESPYAGSTLLVMGNANDILWFDETSPDVFVALYGRLDTLEYLTISGGHEYRLSSLDGTVVKFNDFDHPTRPGEFKSIASPGGTTLSVTELGGGVLDVQRSYMPDGSTTITESFEYVYFNSGTNINELQTCTLRRRVNAGAWQNIRQAVYTYYGASESFGSLNDLKTVTRKDWNGSAWVNLDVNYYRYYKSGDSNGFEHALKYVVGPEAYARMVAASIDPLTVSSSTLAQYADNYFEFDGDHRVTREDTNAGTRTFAFDYDTNPNTPPSEPDFNRWDRKTTETLPDGTVKIVYTNSNGMTMLEVLQSGSDQWCRFTKYNDDGQPILQAESSAISGYDDQYDDLLHFTGGSYQYLKNTTGLIRVFDYYTTTGSGAADGYLQYEKIKQGETGTELKLRELQYTSNTDSGGVTVFPVSKEIAYPSDTDQSIKIETSYSYTFLSGTNQVQQKSTTWPSISTSQNGTGIANARVEVYDAYGNRTWLKDERGFITRVKYDIATGAVTQQIDDVDTALVSDEPSGWTTPAGGGLHLISDFEYDTLGRTTQALGPSHSVDLAGTATTIRTAMWTVYKDTDFQTWSGRGYATGSSPSYTYTLVNPVNLTKFDQNGNVVESIQAARASTNGALSASDSFPQSSYRRWTTNQYTDCCKAESTRVYSLIPSSGSGSSGTNYDQTDFGYDLRERRNRVVTPGGTITRTVFDARSQPQKIYAGTNDNGATASDPTGGGASGNNMVLVTQNEFDGGSAGGDGNLTKVTQQVDGSTTRITNFTFDWRNRQTVADGEVDFYSKTYHDNLDRVTKRERYDTTSSGNIIARSEAKFDDLSRVYQAISYEVNPSSGTVGNILTDNTWYDGIGNILKQLPAGSKLFSKFVYDGVGRQTKRYLGFDTTETTHADATNVNNDTLFEQYETTYDAASNTIKTIVRQRYHDATGTGELTSPSGSQPKARVLYSAAWPDGVGRNAAAAAYGTNGGTALSRPSTIPTRSDTVLVTTTEFDDAGMPYKITDPAATITQATFDHAGRRTKLIENYVDGNPATGTADQDRTTEWTYNGDGNVLTFTAKNSDTSDQVTKYVYGTTLTDSAIASNLLLRAEIYPDSDDATSPLGNGTDGIYDRIEYKYDRQGGVTELKDQRATIRAFNYDGLGRLTQDRVTTLSTGVDGAVRRIATTYEVRGMPVKTTSYDNATVGSGSIVNEVQRAYNNFGQLTQEYQSHSGPVNTGTTPSCQYAYADGSANHVRLTSMTYPSGRALNYNYGTGSGINDNSSRIASLIDNNGSTHIADYSYLGMQAVVEVDEAGPQLKYTLIGTAGGDDPNTGDIYRGLDRFGRVKEHLWRRYGSGSFDALRIHHGYDRASNRLYRRDYSDTSNFHDELYGYDGLNRLKQLDRGTLNSGFTAITTLKFAQQWTLDPTGNWKTFQQDDDGNTTWDMVQNRTANKVNEITAIAETTGPGLAPPAYDLAGNMTNIPRATPPLTWSGLTLDGWSKLTLDQWSTMVLSLSYTGVYDAWNRLVRFTDGTNTIQENVYDGRNFRVVKKKYTAGSLTETRHLYYSAGWQVLEERVGASSSANRQFVWGLRYIDDLVLRDRDTNADGTLEERLFALQDPNWNLVAVADTSGAIQERYCYDAYGNPTVLDSSYNPRSSSSYDWETRYAGYRWDEETQLYVVRNRLLQPSTGFWLSRDPIGYEAGVNLYEYVNSNAIRGIDPLGLQDPLSAGFKGDTNYFLDRYGNEFRPAEVPAKPNPCCGEGRSPDRCVYVFTWEHDSGTMVAGHSGVGLSAEGDVYGFHKPGFTTDLRRGGGPSNMQRFRLRSVYKCCCLTTSELKEYERRIGQMEAKANRNEDLLVSNNDPTDLYGQRYLPVSGEDFFELQRQTGPFPPYPSTLPRTTPTPNCSGAAGGAITGLGCNNMQHEFGNTPNRLESHLSRSKSCQKVDSPHLESTKRHYLERLEEERRRRLRPPHVDIYLII